MKKSIKKGGNYYVTSNYAPLRDEQKRLEIQIQNQSTHKKHTFQVAGQRHNPLKEAAW